EPCAHFGKTPPCADLIIEKQIPKVVVGIVDPFAQVCGEGINKMREKGIEVTVGVLENECRELNKRFLWNVKTDLPYVILKWAETKDGFMDRDRDSHEQKINWISSPSTKAITHTWRREEAGILVGINTLLNDDPMLTIREVVGLNPARIIVDSKLKMKSEKLKIKDVDGQNLVYNQLESFTEGNTEYIQLKDFTLKAILQDLKQRNISSILVEGGAYTLNQFIQENLWNEARVYQSNEVEFGSGLAAPTLPQEFIESRITLEKEDLILFVNTTPGLLDYRSKT
ncbi:MAG: bifunctional diaminohydroxyphosphoribosylaminopyrimidine deaminase/5-amino-6-(5-phosphoribosylamino)uracil reductase RibD, partial [Crocinitomicaceae bacterium]|nr:bifunctional diaminohydroxyphosphoribosylaminopyrimidine deaminase/5-amino-6-(5-phosphoribosylamino)uracil reductase RibD [Crocinitomicaceae bacterium]